jgi:LysR family transcriptional regulator, cell division regulator
MRKAYSEGKRFVDIEAITLNDGCMDARTLPDLIVFLEVVRAGSLTRAAERLHTVQSNVTARIKSLERAVGAPLLRRHARGVRPTPAGEAALMLAQRTDAVLDDLRFTFGRDTGKRTVKVRLGAIETVAAVHLPALVASFARQHPNVDLSVQAGSSAALLEDLKRGDLDVAFVSRPSKLDGFREQIVFRDELVVVAPPAWESLANLLAESKTDSAAPLKVLVQRLGCSYTDRLLAYLAARSSPRPRLLEIGTLEGILRFVAAGIGVAAMPRAFVSSLAGHRQVQLFQLPRQLRRLDTYLVAPLPANGSLAANELVAYAGR